MLLSSWVTSRFSSPTLSGNTFICSGVKFQSGLIQAMSQDATLPGEHEKLARAPQFCLHVPAPSNNLFSPLFLQLKMRELYYVLSQDPLPFKYSDFYDLELHCQFNQMVYLEKGVSMTSSLKGGLSLLFQPLSQLRDGSGRDKTRQQMAPLVVGQCVFFQILGTVLGKKKVQHQNSKCNNKR